MNQCKMCKKDTQKLYPSPNPAVVDGRVCTKCYGIINRITDARRLDLEKEKRSKCKDQVKKN